MHKLLPENLYTADQVRQLDHAAIHDYGLSGFELMSRAAQTTIDVICQKWPNLQSMQVFCGGGNNGGDGYLIAQLAYQKEIDVSVVTLKDPGDLTGDAQQAYRHCHDVGVPVAPFDKGIEITAELIVDAMLGTGLSRDIGGPYQEAIMAINTASVPCCAVDIPSGLCSDTGYPMGGCIKADLTVSFIGLKQGLLTGEGRAYCGDLQFDDLSVPAEVYEQVQPSCLRISQRSLKGAINSRSRTAHKGDNGHVLLLGGNYGMPGAISMAAEAAIYSGAGKVTVVTREEHLSALAIRRPEVMARSVESNTEFRALLNTIDVVVAGPGLGKDDWGLALLREVLVSESSIVLDADALNLLSQHPQLHQRRKSPMILTPHPGEAARLLQTHSHDIQRNRFAAVADCVDQFGAITLLKGSGTLISNGVTTYLCSAGNPGMAVAGMGDVLSGVLGALLAQGVEPFKATQLACWLHSGAADDIVVRQGEIGLLATQLIPVIRAKLNELLVLEER
ncbi:hypothetical protein ACH42_15325 [Endozoicomonas sp. (ex Bugula neritina AB1)]|nr:hypothetical protein ACH42_15325 [Endozoicomonas sp. (ex Bugula neritina AB1)]